MRLRLTAAFTLSMAVVLATLGVLLYLSLSHELLAGIDRDLGARADALTSALAADPGIPLEGGHRFVDPDEAFAQVLDVRGRLLDATAGVSGAALLTPAQATAATRARFSTMPASARDDPRRLLAVPSTVGGQPRIVVVGQTLGDREDALHRLLVAEILVGGAALVLTSAAGWMLAGAALRPVERMRARAARLAEVGGRDLLPVPGTGDELSRLAETLNSLLAHQQAALDREHRFVDDASHELRTPLAVLKAELDLALSRPRTANELLETVRTSAGETDRLVRLAEDLLVLARVRERGLPLRYQPVDLPELLASAVAPLVAQAADDGRELRIEAPQQPVEVDPDRVRQAVLNLVENALHHGLGDITLSAAVVREGVLIEVHDQGPGFADSIGASAFEPFRRGRPGSRPEGGAGLGLTIVKAVADAHGGSVSTYADADGTGVRLLVPPAAPTD